MHKYADAKTFRTSGDRLPHEDSQTVFKKIYACMYIFKIHLNKTDSLEVYSKVQKYVFHSFLILNSTPMTGKAELSSIKLSSIYSSAAYTDIF